MDFKRAGACFSISFAKISFTIHSQEELCQKVIGRLKAANVRPQIARRLCSEEFLSVPSKPQRGTTPNGNPSDVAIPNAAHIPSRAGMARIMRSVSN